MVHLYLIIGCIVMSQGQNDGGQPFENLFGKTCGRQGAVVGLGGGFGGGSSTGSDATNCSQHDSNMVCIQGLQSHTGRCVCIIGYEIGPDGICIEIVS